MRQLGWVCRERKIVLDFQWPRAWIAVWSTLETRRVVAPPEPTRAEAVSFDAIRRDVSDVVDGASSMPQFGNDVVGCDVVRVMPRVIVVIKGAIGRSVVFLVEMVHT